MSRPVVEFAGEVYMPLSDLVGSTALAEQLEVAHKTLMRWAERRASTRFPEPVLLVGTTAVYSLTECQEWHRLWKATRG